MNHWTLGFVLLILLGLGLDTDETVVRTSGTEPYVVRVCNNDTLDVLTLISCEVWTRRGGGQTCHLLYQGQDVPDGCGSRFRFRTEGGTVFLHLSRLTPGESWSYTCSCLHANESHSVPTLNATVEVIGQSRRSVLRLLCVTAVIANVAAFIIVTGFVLGLTLRNKRCRDCAETGPCGQPAFGLICSLAREEPDDPQTGLQETSDDFYQNIVIQTNSANNPQIQKQETYHIHEIYENI